MIGVITGGRDYYPELGELEQLEAVGKAQGVTVWRQGGCPTGVDKIASGYLRARGLEVERWPADWDKHGPGGGPIRNRAMLDGHHREGPREPARLLARFEGGTGTNDCTAAAIERLIAPVWIGAELEHEPRIWNRHHGAPPCAGELAVYVGRGSPLGNPFTLDRSRTREAQAEEILGRYREWLWGQMRRRSPQLAALHGLRADSVLVCSCWPQRCHAEVIVRAWRWMEKVRKSKE